MSTTYGTPAEAARALGIDAADVWELVAAGKLVATAGPPWIISTTEPEPEFTVQDGLAWLGISRADYLKSDQILQGRHGNPINSALLDARRAQGTETTPAEILARHGIDPANPLAAVRAYDRTRRRFDA